MAFVLEKVANGPPLAGRYPSSRSWAAAVVIEPAAKATVSSAVRMILLITSLSSPKIRSSIAPALRVALPGRGPDRRQANYDPPRAPRQGLRAAPGQARADRRGARSRARAAYSARPEGW